MHRLTALLDAGPRDGRTRAALLLRRHGDEPVTDNLTYDGQFTFARIKYATGPGRYYYRNLPAWAHGYVPDPRRGGGRGEDNLMKIMNEVTYLQPHLDGSVVHALDDPPLFKYPVREVPDGRTRR